MAPKRKLDEEDGDASSGSAGEEKQDVAASATESASPAKKGRGRPRKSDGEKKPYTPTGKPRGRPRTKTPKSETDSSDVEGSPPAQQKKRGRPSLASKIGTDNDVNDQPTKSDQPRKRGRPLGSTKKGKGSTAIQVKKKYLKKEKYHLQVKPFRIRMKFNPKPTAVKKFLTVKPLKTDPLPKNKSATSSCTVKLVQLQKDDKSDIPRVGIRNSGSSSMNLSSSGATFMKPCNSRTTHLNPVYNVTPSKGSNNARHPMLSEYQRSLLHVNHSKHLLNYECDREPALDVLQKKLLAVNTQLIDTEEQRLELDKRIIIFKQRKIELERQLLNYRPQRRVLTRVEQVPIIDIVNDQENGVAHGAKIQGWVSVADDPLNNPNYSPSLKNCERIPHFQTSSPLSADDSKKEVKKAKKVTSPTEKRGRGRPRKQE